MSLLERGVWIPSVAREIETVFRIFSTGIIRYNLNVTTAYTDFSSHTSVMPVASARPAPHGRATMDGKYSDHRWIHSSKDVEVRG